MFSEEMALLTCCMDQKLLLLYLCRVLMLIYWIAVVIVQCTESLILVIPTEYDS